MTALQLEDDLFALFTVQVAGQVRVHQLAGKWLVVGDIQILDGRGWRVGLD